MLKKRKWQKLQTFGKRGPKSTNGEGKICSQLSQQWIYTRNSLFLEKLLILKRAASHYISCHTLHNRNIQRKSNLTSTCKQKRCCVIFRLGRKVLPQNNKHIKFAPQLGSYQRLWKFSQKMFPFSNKSGEEEISHFCNFFQYSEVTSGMILFNYW